MTTRSLASAAGIVLAASLLAGDVAAAPKGELSGNWTGGGTVTLPSGQTEKARCKARFEPYGPRSFSMSAVCATPSARVEQAARVRSTGGNTYAGSFRNPDFNIVGIVRITVRGNSLTASLAGGGGTALLSMKR
ncbi:MAG: hypothetical protein NW205_02670 [Hyphomicrobiaceae bacterium]|nr:hypothetical protein [Hyphomicrobiaceae bacterium]